MNRDELEKRNVGENLDALMNLDPRGYGVCRILYAGSRAFTGEPLTMHAAQVLCDSVKENDLVYILVGFVLLPHKVPEMDGTVSAMLLARALGCLSYQNVAPRKVLSVFLLHYAVAMGYRPRLKHCVQCGERLPEEDSVLFDIEQGGVVCSRCAGQSRRATMLSPAERAWLAEALAQGVRGELPPEDAPLPLLQAYLESRLEKRIPPLLTPL